MKSLDSFDARRTLAAGGGSWTMFSLEAAGGRLGDLSRLPVSLKILLENLLRHEDGDTVTGDHIRAVAGWGRRRTGGEEIAFRPGRVLMQDFTGVPAIADLAAMRDAMEARGGDGGRIDPLTHVDLVIDHSLQVDRFGSPGAFARNTALEMERNLERYRFLRWAQGAFDRLRVVPPGTGICHQVNLEYLARVVWSEDGMAFPDTLVGTDSHTTMVNALAVLGWGVGGIEAEAAMLGQPISMPVPAVTGCRLKGQPRQGVTATDLVLTLTQKLRQKGVVGRFVEFFGPGLDRLSLADRATVANMAPEYGATCGLFPIDEKTTGYLAFTGRAPEQVQLVEAYARAQGLWRQDGAPEPLFSDVMEMDLAEIEPCLAGPRRPQDRIPLAQVAAGFEEVLAEEGRAAGERRSAALAGGGLLEDGAVAIAAITSCTNTSNPAVMLAAGLVARKALERGLRPRPWVKTSLAPGSRAVSDYLARAGLQEALDAQGFHLVGYGCTTCIGNSGPLAQAVQDAIDQGGLAVAAVLSGNRNFEGRVHPATRANYLASPPLVVAYALAGSVAVDLASEPLGRGSDGRPVHLADIWPSGEEIEEAMALALDSDAFRRVYADLFDGDEAWRAMDVPGGRLYAWDERSTYIRRPPFFDWDAPTGEIRGARALALLGDSITTDHISPAGAIAAESPAGRWLAQRGVARRDFNSYGARRGNHEVMMRGTFANIRLKNAMAAGREGGFTRHQPSGEIMTLWEAAGRYRREGVPLLVVAGREYGTGSSRDWAAKGTRGLGVRAVIAESFERIHRSNLIGMGVLPLQFAAGQSWLGLGLDGSESWRIAGLDQGVRPGMAVEAEIGRAGGGSERVALTLRIDTGNEAAFYGSGGILQHCLAAKALTGT